MSSDMLTRIIGEDNSAVSVGLEVDTNIKVGCFVVQMLHAGGSASDCKTEILFDIFGAGAVCIRGLDNAYVQNFSKSRLAAQVREKCGR